MSRGPMRMRLRPLGEPNLIFGGGLISNDPRMALGKSGPFDLRKGEIQRIRLGLVAPEAEIPAILRWFATLDEMLVDSANNALRYERGQRFKRVC